MHLFTFSLQTFNISWLWRVLFDSLKFFRRELPGGLQIFPNLHQNTTCLDSRKYSSVEHDCDSRHFQPTLRCHRTVDDHLFPHDQTCDAKGTRGEWWTCCVSQQNDNKWGEDMGKREYKSQYSTEPKLSHGTRWTVRLSNDASSYWLGSFQKLKLIIVRYFNWSLF